MKIFLDSDVLLDFLLGREPFLNDIKWILELSLKKQFKLHTSSLAIANIHYLIAKTINAEQAFTRVNKLITFVKIIKVGEKEIKCSLQSKFKDFEDGVQNFSALHAEMEVIVTRNIKDFKTSSLPIFTPQEFLAKTRK